MGTELALGVATAAAAAVFLCAGLGKLAVPGPAARAIAELLEFGPRPAGVLVRATGVLEAATGVALVVPATRPVGVPAAGVLGAGFILLGVVARMQRVSASCGCFGSAQGHPFGLRNAVYGAALLAVAVVDTLVPYPAHPAQPALPLALTAAGCVCLSAWLHRALIISVLGPRARPSTPEGVGA